MRPVIEETRIDRITNENFESLRQVLGGNLSFDNMAIQILEGTTQDSDSQNLVNHSGKSRPVGWFPLVGDIYIQEISDKHIDIRSTKPEVNYKIVLLFGPNITNESVRAEGGDNYKTTEEVTNQLVEIGINNIEEIDVTFKPTVVRNFTNENIGTTTTPSAQYNSVVTDGDYFYITTSDPGAQINFLKRVDRSTGTSDTLDLSGSTTQELTALQLDGTDLYIATDGYDGSNYKILKVDTSSFTLSDTYSYGTSNILQDVLDIHVDSNDIYVTGTNGTGTTSYLVKFDKANTGYTSLSLKTSIGNCEGRKIMEVGTDLWIIVDDDRENSTSLVQVEKSSFTVSNTHTGSDALEAKTAIYHNGAIYAPVRYSAAHAGSGGTVSYMNAIVKFDISSTSFTFTPVGGALSTFRDTIIQDNDYLYIVSFDGTHQGGAIIIRYDTLDDSYITAWIPFFVSGTGIYSLNSLALVDTDGDILYIRNTANGEYRNFEYAKVDFSDYND